MGINFRSVKGFYVVVSHNGVPEKQTKKKKLKNVMSRRNLKMLLSSSVHCDFTSLPWHGLIKHFLPSYWKINGHVHRCKWKKCVMYVCKWEKKVFLFILTLLLETLLTADTSVVQPQISDVCPWPYVVEKKEMKAVINPQVSAQNRKISGFGVSINDR